MDINLQFYGRFWNDINEFDGDNVTTIYNTMYSIPPPLSLYIRLQLFLFSSTAHTEKKKKELIIIKHTVVVIVAQRQLRNFSN